jgi:hypothetical protein
VRYALFSVVLGACAERVPLSRVPVRGGTADQHAQVRDILEEFEADSGEGRVQLTEVVFGQIYGDATGTFNAVTDVIRMEPYLEGPPLERVLRHELCHALDFAEGLMEGPHPTFDPLIHDLFMLGAIDTDGLEGPRYRRSEAFARYCDLGPFVGHALIAACPGEPDEVNDATAYLSREVWQTWEPPPSQRGPAVHARWQAPSPDPVAFGVLGLSDPSQIRIQYGTERVDVGLDDGLPRSGSTLFAPQEKLPAGVSHLCPVYGALLDGTGWSEGPAAVLVRFELYREAATPRILTMDGGEWTRVAGCFPQEHIDLFSTADGRLWLAWVEDSTVSWAPLLDPRLTRRSAP